MSLDKIKKTFDDKKITCRKRMKHIMTDKTLRHDHPEPRLIVKSSVKIKYIKIVIADVLFHIYTLNNVGLVQYDGIGISINVSNTSMITRTAIYARSDFSLYSFSGFCTAESGLNAMYR